MTLAQDVLDAPPVADLDAPGLAIWGHLQARLAGASSPEEAPLLAEKFVFNENAPQTVSELVRAGSVDKNVPFLVCGLPTDPCWVEWSLGGIRLGALLDTSIVWEDGGLHTTITFAGKSRGHAARPLFLMRAPALPWTQKNIRDDAYNCAMCWCYAKDIDTRESQAAQAKTTMRELVYCLFLINTPRIAEVEEVIPPARLNAKRRTARRPPLVEYRRLTLRVGVARARSGRAADSPPAEGEAERRRLHQVMGHIRVYQKRRDVPHVTWIPPHWRGDASLGVVLHERRVRMEGEK